MDVLVPGKEKAKCSLPGTYCWLKIYKKRLRHWGRLQHFSDLAGLGGQFPDKNERNGMKGNWELERGWPCCRASYVWYLKQNRCSKYIMSRRMQITIIRYKFQTRHTNTSATTNYANVAYDLLTHNMASATLIVDRVIAIGVIVIDLWWNTVYVFFGVVCV